VGTPPLNYQWRFKGTNLDWGTNAWLALTNVQPANQGAYSVVVSNAYGSTVSSNANLKVVHSLVVAWGSNSAGQTNVPPGLTNVIAIAAGGLFSDGHCLALKADGTVVAWGAGNDYYHNWSYGQANVPSGLSNVVAVAAGSLHSLALRSNGTVVAWGYNSNGQTNVPAGLSNVVAIAAGYAHSLALKSDGTVAAWGYDSLNNILTGLSNVVAIAADYYHSLALKRDGTVVAGGAEIPTDVLASLTNIVAIAAGYSHGVALRSSGTVATWGVSYYSPGPVIPPPGLSNVIAIAAGGEYSGVHSVALRSDGSVVAWGSNGYGQTNVPSDLPNAMAIAAGSDHSLALVNDTPPVLQVRLAGLARSGDRVNISVPTQSGRVYGLEYKNALTDTTWTALPLVAGNGAELVLTDPTATNSQRFYCIRRW
jgi:alpha-tubulin suppressor-like RCC1 family protein